MLDLEKKLRIVWPFMPKNVSYVATVLVSRMNHVDSPTLCYMQLNH
ncbi:hypothetical protein EV211_14910 [Aminicella lysinilytica]|uniref:Uncharacterized protein n=1 Tax=Aminicella lysinilytica TaxID=433323 RepID=A0A4R6PYD2_9FIRM|nr:hypothetical protein EV211_14910 [Aminicella lysinilytica]